MIRMKTYGLLDVKEALKGLNDELVALGPTQGQKTLATAARKAFAPVLEAAKAGIEAVGAVDTGLTRDNIVITTQKPKDGDGVVIVGLRVKKSSEKRVSKHGPKSGKPRYATSPHWRWHWIEGGAPARGIPARPFMRPALDANADKVVANVGTELRKAIDRVLRKRARAAAKPGA